MEAKKAVPKDQSKPSGSSQSVKTRKVFLGGLPPNTVKEDIIKAFEDNGGLLDAQIMTEKVTEKPRGFGFAIFKEYSDVDRLLEQKHYRIKVIFYIKKASCLLSSVFFYFSWLVSRSSETHFVFLQMMYI